MTRKAAIKAADKAFADYIKARDKRCVTCGSTDRLQCSHVFRRWHHATAWDESNAYAQCSACHTFHHRQSEAIFLDWARAKLGNKKYDDLKARWQTISDWKIYQIEEIANYFKNKLGEK
jgi:hypothetical protein